MLAMLLGPDAAVSVYALHPGLVRTDFFRHYPWYQQCVIRPVTWLFSKESWYGAQTTIYCAVEESIEMDTGKYYRYRTWLVLFSFYSSLLGILCFGCYTLMSLLYVLFLYHICSMFYFRFTVNFVIFVWKSNIIKTVALPEKRSLCFYTNSSNGN